MKLLYCLQCGDIVKMTMEKRTCRCTKAWGYYKDKETVVQTSNSMSIGFANPDFESASTNLFYNPVGYSPVFSFRAWFNPIDAEDIEWVTEEGEPIENLHTGDRGQDKAD